MPLEGLNNEEGSSKSEFGIEKEGMGREEERREGRDSRKEKGWEAEEVASGEKSVSLFGPRRC